MAELSRITIEPGKRGGRPCIRGLRITVHDVLSMPADKVSEADFLYDSGSLQPASMRPKTGVRSTAPFFLHFAPTRPEAHAAVAVGAIIGC